MLYYPQGDYSVYDLYPSFITKLVNRQDYLCWLVGVFFLRNIDSSIWNDVSFLSAINNNVNWRDPEYISMKVIRLVVNWWKALLWEWMELYLTPLLMAIYWHVVRMWKEFNSPQTTFVSKMRMQKTDLQWWKGERASEIRRMTFVI